MIPKKIPARGEAQPGFQTTFSSLNYTPCQHLRRALVRIDCGGAGTQYREYCTTCWHSLGGAIPHIQARAEEARSGIEAPLADLDVIHAAQNCFERRARNGMTP